MEKKKLGFVFTSSYCTLDEVLLQVSLLVGDGHEVFPIASENLVAYDTRFGKSVKFRESVEKITGKKLIDTFVEAEKFGPSEPLDAIVVAPATGNFVAKLSNGITDNAALMATKATLRNGSPIVIGVSTNDGLGANGQNITRLLNTKNIYFIPFGQDDPVKKPNSLIAHYDQLVPTLYDALERKQFQPVLKEHQKILK